MPKHVQITLGVFSTIMNFDFFVLFKVEFGF
jgi:hypothetical protein